MKLKFESDLKEKNKWMEDRSEEIKTDIIGLDKFINISELFEYYTDDNMNGMLEKLDKLPLPNLSEDFNLLSKYQHIKGIENIKDTSVQEITQKYFEIRTAINSVLDVRHKYILYRQNWEEVSTFIGNLYERKKDNKMLQNELKEYKNQDLREAKVNEWLLPLIKQKDKIKIAMMRVKQFSDEITFTLDYLNGVNSEMSRIQSAIVLALDCGEIQRCNWKQ